MVELCYCCARWLAAKGDRKKKRPRKMCHFCVRWPQKKLRKGIDLGGPHKFEFHFSTLFVHDGFEQPNSVESVNISGKPCYSFHLNEVLPITKH